MNEAGRNALRQAALRGVKQIIGNYSDTAGGRCALGVLADAHRNAMYHDFRPFGLHVLIGACPLCGATTISGQQKFPIAAEHHLVAHMNDDHHLDFLGIAEKMPVSEERQP